MGMHVDARFMKSDASDLDDAAWSARNLVPGCQVRVREGRSTVFGPCLAKDLAARYEVRQ